MTEIDLDQPSQTGSAGADSVNGGSGNATAGGNVKTVLDRVLSAVGAIASGIQQQMAKVAVKSAVPSDSKMGHKAATSAAANYRPWGRYEKKPASAESGSIGGSEKTQAMDEKSRKITAHEERHAAALRDVSPQSKPVLTKQQGPDGRKYAVAGEVNADLAPVKGNPRATEIKAESVYRSAMSDSNRSAEDNEAGRRAMGVAQSARQTESRRMNSPENAGAMDVAGVTTKMSSPYNASSHSVKMRSPSSFMVKSVRAKRYIQRHGTKIGQTVGTAVGGFQGMAIGRAAGQAASAVAGGALGRGAAVGIGSVAVMAAPVAAVVAGFAALVKVTDVLTHSYDSVTARLKNYSSEIAVQSARNWILQRSQNIEQAKQIGKPLGELEAQKGRFERGQNQTSGDIGSVILPVMNEMLQSFNIAIDFVRTGITGISRMLAPISQWIGSFWDDFNKWGEWMLKKWKDFWGVEVKAKDVFDPNFAALLGMKMPMPGELPNVNGKQKLANIGVGVPMGMAAPMKLLMPVGP